MSNFFKRGMFGASLGSALYSDPPPLGLPGTQSPPEACADVPGLGVLGWGCREVVGPAGVGPGGSCLWWREKAVVGHPTPGGRKPDGTGQVGVDGAGG